MGQPNLSNVVRAGDKLNFRIRRAGFDDLPQIQRNENAAHITPWPENLIKNSLQTEQLSWVIGVRDKVVGHMIVLPVIDTWELLNVAVHPNYQQIGLGQRWITYLFEQARLSAIKSITLEVRQSNATAIALYLKNGFVQVGLRNNYYRQRQGRENALVMQTALLY